MKLTKFFLPLVLLVLFSMRADADPTNLGCRQSGAVANLLTDVIVVRPVGFVGTLVGGGLFIGLSPLTGLASITPPHDAFQKVGAILVGIPYAYTFVRPLGYFPNSCY